MDKIHFDGPVVLAILDGVGLAMAGPGNAVSKAKTTFLGKAVKEYPHIMLEASGEAVGLNAGVMGNSEVGHNTIGCGQIIKQGISHIDAAFDSGEIWQSKAWQENIENLKNSNGTLHFAGIFSDGGVHSHIRHLEGMIKEAVTEGIKRIRVHAIFDGRDVPPQSEPKYIEQFEKFAKEFPDADIRIASGGGRMTTVSDRYGNDWSMVERGFNMMVWGKSQNYFSSAKEAINNFRQKNPELQDQYLPDFVVVDNNLVPIGKIEKGDSLIYFDFRADRAIEITRAFVDADFEHFLRGEYSPSDIFFAGLTEYDADSHLPENQLVPPVTITDTLHSFLGTSRISELAVSETAKFGHITYYFNGNSHEKVLLEEFIEIPSDTEPFNLHPEMKAKEITDAVIGAIHAQDCPDFIRINYPNGDMVGHFADIDATVLAVEAVDRELTRLAGAIDDTGGCLIITADHGNAEELLDKNGEKKTSHTTNKVPFIIYDNTENRKKYRLNELENPGLSNIAATVAILLGATDYPEKWNGPLISVI